MADLLKLGVLISGNGSNLQSIIDHIEKGSLKAIIKIVISNNPEAYGITRAKKHGIPVVVLKNGDFKNKEEFDLELIRILKNNGVDLVILAGFMRIITPALLKAFPHKIMNIHPALLPSFPGIHGQKQALEYGVKLSGCTVHFVDEGVDTGPIIIQSAVQVFVVVLKNGEFKNKEEFDLELIRILKNNCVDLVILAGFMRIITPTLLKAFLIKL